MAMTDFFLVFPKLADNELRNITVGPGSGLGLPAGRYAFAESYCDEQGCDCRRVLIHVYAERSRDYIAHINLGFDAADPMAGSFLDPLAYQAPQAMALMGFFTDMVNTDPAYLARLHRHYVQFKERLDGRRYQGPPFDEPGKIKRVAAAEPPRLPSRDGSVLGSAPRPVRREARIGRNDPCACGSGKKYKHCCMVTPRAAPALAAAPAPQPIATEQPHLVLAKDPALRSQVEQLVAIVALARRQRPGQPARWSAEVQAALESVHPVAFHLLHLLLERYAPDGRQRTPPTEYAVCLELITESLIQVRYSVERRRSLAVAMAESIQTEIADLAFRPEVDVRVQQDLIMALHESKLELHPGLRDKAAEIAGYYARFSARQGTPGLDQTLERLVRQTQPRDAFDLLEPLLAEMALMPAAGAIGLATALMASAHPLLNELAVPMLLYPDRQVRTALPERYRAPAGLARLDPLGLRRLIGLRNWLPADERPTVDALIEAARRAGTHSAALPDTTPIRVHASAIDGSGAQALWLSVKETRGRYRLESVLLRPHEGVREAFSKTDLTKRALDSCARQIEGDLVAIPVRLDYLQRLTGHCIAVGIERGTVPPPQLLVANEWAGGGYWKPARIDAAAEIERLRTADPDAFAPERARRALTNAGNWPHTFAFAGSWFEDDARVEAVLRERIGKPERWMAQLAQAAAVVVGELLERKRDSWSERLVLMALWAESAQTRPPVPWQEFLVNAVQVLKAPLAEVPLMPAIAQRTVETAWRRYQTRG